MSENEELLFFDTFAHGTTEELNLDLVQFPKPVYINQVRVIPLGAKVQADFPGGVRLGATNPSQFKLELFVNDLSKPGASAFETLGVLDYNQNSNIHYDSDKKVPTDGLVLRGWYTTVTLAVYGVITRAPIITVPPPPPPPPVTPQPVVVAPAAPATPSVATPTTPTGPTTPTAPLKSPSPVPPLPPQPPPDSVPVVIGHPEEKVPCSPPVEEKVDKIKSEEVRVSKTEEAEREKETEKEFKVKVEEKVADKPREKSRRSDESNRTRDSGEYRERDWDSERTLKSETERSSRSEHRSRHEGDRSKGDVERTRSESDRVKGDSERGRSEIERERTRTDSDRKRGDSDRVKSERIDSDRTRGESDRSRGDSDRIKSDPDRTRKESERTRSERTDRGESDRPRSDSDRVKGDVDHVKSETERVRPDDRKDPSRRSGRDRDRERRSERSDRKGRSKERKRESSRRPRSPLEEKKTPEVPVASVPSPPPPPPTPPLPTPTKKEEPSFEVFSPGVEMEAISDDEMPEIDTVPGNQNDDELEEEPNDAEETASNLPDTKADSTVGDDVESTVQESETAAATTGEGAVEPEEPEEFEEILSDEDLMFDDYGNDIAELEAVDLPELADIGKPINPYTIELQPLVNFTDPSFTAYQRAARTLAYDRSQSTALEDASTRLKAALDVNTRGENWLESMSQIIGVLPNALVSLKAQGKSDELDSIQQKVIEWVMQGVDFDKALEHVGPSTLIVRHIKAGLKLASTVAQSSPVLLQQAVDEGALAKILSLYAAPHMALSLKLMCLRSVDALLAWPYAMERWRTDPILDSRNGYEHLVKMIEAPQPSRAQVSLAALVKKMNLYESFERVHELCQTLARLPVQQRKDTGQDKEKSNETDEPPPLETASECLKPVLSELLDRLNEIRQIYLNPSLSIGHFVRFLPVHRQFEISASGSANDPLHSIYSFMRHHRFLHVLLLLLTHPSTACNAVIVDQVVFFLDELRKSQHGLCFLAAQPDVTSLILRVLLQSAGQHSQSATTEPTAATESRQDDYASASVAAAAAAAAADELNVTGNQSSLLHRLGIQLAYALHALLCLDALNHQVVTHGKEKAICMIEPMHSLYSMVFNAASRLALVHVLSLDSNLDVLVGYVSADSDPDVESKLKESAMRGYATELVALAVRLTDNAAFYAKYGPVVHELATANQDESSKLNQLSRWVEVANQAHVFTLDSGLPALCDVVKQHADDAANFPPELIVALRLICPLAIEHANRETESNRNVESYVELKYAYAMVQLFGRDMLGTLTGVLSKLCQAYEQPSVHSGVLAGPQGVLLLSVVHPSLRLMRRLLSQVIRCRDSDFHDLTAVPVLLQTYALVSAVPASCLFQPKVSECRSDIVATLLAYSQPAVQANDDISNVNGPSVKPSATPEDALSRSLWTQMIQEVLKFIHSCSGPAAAVTGLEVLNELLPLPLPLVSGQRRLDDDDVKELLNARKLWSVHLHTLGPQIQQVVRMLCTAGTQLLPLLRKVCVQIADLSAATALVVARAALDALLTSCNVQESGATATATKSDEADKEVSVCSLPAVLVCSAQSARILNFLAAIVPHAPIKAAVLQLCRGAQKSDEKYVEFVSCLCLILSSVSPSAAHVQSQECVVTIFGALLDADVCLLPCEKVEHDVYLSAALPSRELVVQIVSGLWDHVASGEQGHSSVLGAARALTVLTEHNYTFSQLARVLERKRHSLWALLNKLASGFSSSSNGGRDATESSGTVLGAVLELLRSLVRPGEATGRHPARSLTVPISSVAAAVQWKCDEAPDDGAGKHPLLAAQDALRELCTDEESMASLRETLARVIDLLHSDPQPGAKKELVESTVPAADPLSVQFAQRAIVCDALPLGDERLASAFWLSSRWHADADAETELVRCDLAEIAQSCLGPDYDLAAAADRLCKLHAEPHEILGHHGSVSAGKGRSGSGTGGGGGTGTGSGGDGRPGDSGHPPGRPILSTARDKSSKPYVAPMRGRGFGRPGVNSRNDPFRSRAPNTSRPPSLHVDDFVALEKNGAVGGSTSAAGVASNLYGAKAARGGGGGGGGSSSGGGRTNSSRTRGTFAGERARFNFQQPRREATRSRPGASVSSSGAGAKWDEMYHSAAVEARTATRFPQANRVWTSSGGSGGGSGGSGSGGTTKERYTSPTAQTPARVRHTRTFSR